MLYMHQRKGVLSFKGNDDTKQSFYTQYKNWICLPVLNKQYVVLMVIVYTLKWYKVSIPYRYGFVLCIIYSALQIEQIFSVSQQSLKCLNSLHKKLALIQTFPQSYQ